MHIKNQKDFFSGLMFIGVGVAFAWGATNYDVGSAAQMGPGYFPLILSVVMVIIGVVLACKAIVVETEGGAKIGKWAWRPLFCIIAANVVFGILLAGLRSISLPAFGMIIAVYAVTFVASMAQAHWKFKTTFVLSTVLAVGSYLVFVLALKLQFQVWPAFITG